MNSDKKCLTHGAQNGGRNISVLRIETDKNKTFRNDDRMRKLKGTTIRNIAANISFGGDPEVKKKSLEKLIFA